MAHCIKDNQKKERKRNMAVWRYSLNVYSATIIA